MTQKMHFNLMQILYWMLLVTLPLGWCKRPLNQPLTNMTITAGGVPFFIAPSTSGPRKVAEQRGGGGGSAPYSSIHELNGIRNKERKSLPPPNPHLDMYGPLIANGNTGSNVGGITPTHIPNPAPNNRLHKNMNNRRKSKFATILQMNKNATFGRNDIGRPVSVPEKFVGPDIDDGSPSSNGNSLQILKGLRNEQNNQHTPSPPSHFNPEGIDFDEKLGVKCSFEKQCAWTWDPINTTEPNFEVVTGDDLKRLNVTGVMPGPSTDILNDASGHFLHLSLTPEATPRILRSPVFSSTREKCYLEMLLHQSSMHRGSIRIVIEPVGTRASSWVPAEIVGDNERKWIHHTFDIDRVSKDFRILLEIVPNHNLNGAIRGHVSIDNIKMQNCFADSPRKDTCSLSQVKCKESKMPVCIEIARICDISVDCDDGEDEKRNCDKIPFGGRCDFENGWCGWQNSGKAMMDWGRLNGPTPTEKTGPEFDHTFQHTNTSGYYMFVNMNQHADDPEKKNLVGFASNSVMNSVVFNPPPLCHSNETSPFKNTCMARLFVHQFGLNSGSFNISVVELKERENITTTLWWSSKNIGDKWERVEVVLPNITSKYFMQVEARKGMRIFSDVAIDDFSMSPECFGFNIPKEHLKNYNYWDPRLSMMKKPHADFVEKKVLKLSSCGVRGTFGPTQADCLKYYNSTNNTEVMSSVRVLDKAPYKGIQTWRVPNEGYYTIIAKGAGGGLGSGGVGSSRGAIVISVLELHKNEEINLLIGQKGEAACLKSMSPQDDEGCAAPIQKQPDYSMVPKSKTHLVKQIYIENGAGGGGGGTYVFLNNAANAAVPLIVAGGGGGLGIGRYVDDDVQHAEGINPNKPDVSGQIESDIDNAAGPGGGWRAKDDAALHAHFGASLLEGARGGLACFKALGIHGHGGFGGGGGGCVDSGGGGGGYSGGDTMINSTNGEGGTSYLIRNRVVQELSFIHSGANSGPGSVTIIPAITGCGCDYLCVALDEFRSEIACICPVGWKLNNENYTNCELIKTKAEVESYVIYIITSFCLVLVLSLLFIMTLLYNRFQRKSRMNRRHNMLVEQDLQLSRLRSNTHDDSTLTNFNPNYGCEGILNGNVDVKSLPQVARESLRLVKALGQGAFGEVYQGLYRHRDGDAIEMPVAVKTLPEMSTGQAESDFLMEAAIMAKFNHPNIVHLIGVCFDRHPRFIVLELLAGGDLKNFLREYRNRPERPAPTTMKDLVFCSLDVAKGCRYMESKRFIHRDIAARNCLLSSKGPGRVVKIADFGMARDIYRSDYYRKGGKAMLPIKWMPPEAFLDGIFTSKTDVWSFGVLLWEVFSLGLMPYTGLPNREVMQLVTGGGRLDAPPGCPMSIYRVMADCWNPSPEQRPTFSNLLERLTACTQDPEIMNAPLVYYYRPSSTEQDTTVMRPTGNDDFCIQIPTSSDYLTPLPSDSRAIAERLMCEATCVTISETPTTYTTTTSSPGSHQHRPDKCRETTFSMPNSKSNQPLLYNSSDNLEERLISLDTPQQTPTTIQPPQPFGNSPTLMPKSNKNAQASITLDPATLSKQQMPIPYANVKMLNTTTLDNGIDNELPRHNGNINNNNNLSKDKNANAPFSIQNYNGENHSEISC